MKQIMAIKEPKRTINKASELFNRIQKINIDYHQENFLVFYLDSQNILKGVDVVFKGGLNTCFIDPKTIFRKALIKNANSIIIAHNHPSGTLKESFDDISASRALRDAGKILKITVLDFIIFNKKEFYSFESNLRLN